MGMTDGHHGLSRPKREFCDKTQMPVIDALLYRVVTKAISNTVHQSSMPMDGFDWQGMISINVSCFQCP